jgi:hypothetical protein
MSTMVRPMAPAGPSDRFEEWPPVGCAAVITTSPGAVSAV